MALQSPTATLPRDGMDRYHGTRPRNRHRRWYTPLDEDKPVLVPRAPFRPGTPIASNWVDNLDGTWDYDLSWPLPPFNGGSPITGYDVHIDGVLTHVANPTPVLANQTITENTWFDVVVAAINAIGTGPDSDLATIKSPGA